MVDTLSPTPSFPGDSLLPALQIKPLFPLGTGALVSTETVSTTSDLVDHTDSTRSSTRTERYSKPITISLLNRQLRESQSRILQLQP